VTSDESITTWKAAAVVPSSNGLSTWMVGVDDAGHVQRVAEEGGPQDVSDRYGLAADKVQSVVAGAGRVAFLLEKGVAVSDGANVTRYDVPAHGVAATAGIVAVADGSAVRIFDQGKETDVALPDAQLVTYDATGVLMAATTHGLYRVNGGAAEKVYDAGGRTIHALTSAGTNVWLTVDGDLGLWQGGHVAVATGGTLAADARLVGSASGDVWVVSAGALLRWGAGGGAGGDEATWNTSVQPVYASVCSNCHGPPGSGKTSSNIDLSTYAAWSARRSSVYLRVVTQAGSATQMPPSSSGLTLTDAQRSAIQAWSKP
jgi:mono/diheme cytochrome c family protein